MRILFLFIFFFSHSVLAEPNIEKLLNDKWLEVKTENFTIVTDASKKKANVLIRDLESFRYFITDILGVELVSADPLTILALSSSRSFKRLDLPEFWAGVFLSGASGDFAVANITRYSSSKKKKNWGNQVLMHEYVHFVEKNRTHSVFYPLWYQEGQAEYLGSFRIDPSGEYATIGDLEVIGTRLYSMMGNFSNKIQKVDVEDLFKTTNINASWRRGDKGKQKKKDKKDGQKFYARAMLTYHYFKSKRELGSKLEKYLTLVNSGKSVDYAFSTAFNMSYEELDDAISGYISAKYVNTLKINIGGLNDALKDIKPTIRQLDKASLFPYIFKPILRLGTYSLAEKDKLVSLVDQYAPNDVETQLAKILYLAMSVHFDLSELNELEKKDKKRKQLEKLKRSMPQLSLSEANRQLDLLFEKHPKNADILAIKAYINLDPALRRLEVGHPKGNRDLANLRNLARSALRLDERNGIAYYVLGVATTDSGENRQKFLGEAAVALDSAKYLLGVKDLKSKLVNEMEVNMLLGNSASVLTLARQYRTSHSNDWITKDYGLFFVEAHETRALPHLGEIVKVEKASIEYEDGSIYSGEIQGNFPNGLGKLTTYYGASMSGTWVNGYLEGQGDFIASNQYHYIGNFTNGHISGRGEVIYPEGAYFKRSEGEFLMGMEHGDHLFEFSDGRVHSGQDFMGAPHGETVISEDGKEIAKFEAFRGGYRQKISDTLTFTGAIDEDLRANGWGSCYDKANERVWRCFFHEGKLNDKAPTVTSFAR